jgi:hypothetical protein
MTQTTYQVIMIHPDAPPKPEYGQPCNGCGVCCHSELCPVGIVRFWKIKGRCPALLWDHQASKYRCNLLHAEKQTLLRKWIYRSIGAGLGCDAHIETIEQNINYERKSS